MGDEQANNVHSLDEWRSQQRNRDAHGPQAPWMRRQRTRERRALRSGARRGNSGQMGRSSPYGHRNTLGERIVPGQRPDPNRSGTAGRHVGQHFGGRTGDRFVGNRSSFDADPRSPYGHPLRSVARSVRSRTFAQRLVSACLWISGAVVVISALLLWNSMPPRQLPPDPRPPLLRLWAAVDDDYMISLRAVLEAFEREHGVQIELHNNLPPGYDLVRTLMAGYGPDVMLVDAETSARLFALEALQPLAGAPDQANGTDPRPEEEANPPAEATRSVETELDAMADPAAYVLRLAEESLWVRSLRAVIPLHARDAALARQFIAYIANVSDVITHAD